ncbi:DNA-dependent RNA polymerase I [Ceraceosorus bombacis]|uniref:DNA-dependent RNA polymerase I n=1 Tax=Ceraceosorus bombacis TaxID=401625 RepID=A0A0P1B981_9BASI|nr:DNA-dependent RNA polymerase I [Ceraceosorus bombacis]
MSESESIGSTSYASSYASASGMESDSNYSTSSVDPHSASGSSKGKAKQDKEDRRRRKLEKRQRERERGSNGVAGAHLRGLTVDHERSGGGSGSGRGGGGGGGEEGEELDVHVHTDMSKEEATSAFRVVYASFNLAIPPSLLHDPMTALLEIWDSLLIRYIPQLSGVLIAHDEHMFLRSSAAIDGDGAFATIPAAIKALVWAPQVGQRLEGKLTLSTSSHVSLLVHGTFNASISSMHLPTSESLALAESNSTSFERPNRGAQVWSFVEGYDLDGVGEHARAGAESEHHQQQQQQEEEEEEGDGRKSTGCWAKEDGGRLGGENGRIVFTVIGLTITSHTLSLHGSLLPSPFSLPLPHHSLPTHKSFLPFASRYGAASGRSGRRGKRSTNGGHGMEEEEEKEFQGAAAGAGARRVRWTGVDFDEIANADVGRGKEEGEGSEKEGSALAYESGEEDEKRSSATRGETKEERRARREERKRKKQRLLDESRRKKEAKRAASSSSSSEKRKLKEKEEEEGESVRGSGKEKRRKVDG